MTFDLCQIYRSEYYRTMVWLQNFTDYFPVKIVKTVDLPPTKNYLFAVYPHGVIRLVHELLIIQFSRKNQSEIQNDFNLN